MRYKITLSLDNGDKIEIKSVGNSAFDALTYLQQQPDYIKFVANNNVVNVNIIEDNEKELQNNYLVALAEDKNGFAVTDTTNNVVCKFNFCHFNDTANVTPLDDKTELSAVNAAIINRQLADFVFAKLRPFAQICNVEQLREFVSNRVMQMRNARSWSRYKLSAKTYKIFGEKQGITSTQIRDLEENRFIPRIDTLYKVIVALLDVSAI